MTPSTSMPSFSIASASARMPSRDVFSERKSSSMMTMGKRNFMAVRPVCLGGTKFARGPSGDPGQRGHGMKGAIMGRFAPMAMTRRRAAALRRRDNRRQIFGSVTPCCPWYLPPRSLYEVSQTSSDSKKITCATPSLA